MTIWDFWNQLDSSLKTAIVSILLAPFSVLAAWIVTRASRFQERAKHKTEIDEMKSQNDKSRLANEEFVRKTADTFNARWNQSQTELAIMRKDGQDARESFAHDKGVMEGKIAVLMTQNSDLALSNTARDKLAAGQEKKIEAALRQIDDLTKQIAALQAAIADKDVALKHTTAKLNKESQEKAELQVEVQHLQAKVTALESEVATAKRDAEVLRRRVSELENKPSTGTLLQAVSA